MGAVRFGNRSHPPNKLGPQDHTPHILGVNEW